MTKPPESTNANEISIIASDRLYEDEVERVAFSAKFSTTISLESLCRNATIFTVVHIYISL